MCTLSYERVTVVRIPSQQPAGPPPARLLGLGRGRTGGGRQRQPFEFTGAPACSRPAQTLSVLRALGGAGIGRTGCGAALRVPAPVGVAACRTARSMSTLPLVYLARPSARQDYRPGRCSSAQTMAPHSLVPILQHVRQQVGRNLLDRLVCRGLACAVRERASHRGPGGSRPSWE